MSYSFVNVYNLSFLQSEMSFHLLNKCESAKRQERQINEVFTYKSRLFFPGKSKNSRHKNSLKTAKTHEKVQKLKNTKFLGAKNFVLD